jgi:hypothetical protein
VGNTITKEHSVSGVVYVSAPGQQITTQMRWTGTGGPANSPPADLSVTLLADLT